MDDILQRIAGEQSNSGPDDGDNDGSFAAIAEIADDIAGRRAELCLLESRVGRLQRQNAELDARWLEPKSVVADTGVVEPQLPIGIERSIDIPTPPVPRPHVAPNRPRVGDDRAGRPPRRGIRVIFGRARIAPSAAQESPAPRTNS